MCIRDRSIILQSQSQLKTIYKDAADTITGNCDCTLFLGGKEKSTPVSYTHLDVYKRQPLCFTGENLRKAAAQGKMEQLKQLLAGKEICL